MKKLDKRGPIILLSAALVVAVAIAMWPSGDRKQAQPFAPTANEAPTSLGGGPSNGPLPPGHPPLPNGTTAPFVAETPVAAIEWTAPARWQAVPSTSTMRIATYRIPHAVGDAEDAELSITRVGGGTDANIERWVGQFDPSAKATVARTSRVISGFNVVVVHMRGTYSGMSENPEAGWALLGAVIETPGTAHFLKMTGPAKTVEAARAELDAMLSTIRPR